MSTVEFSRTSELLKVNDELGLVFGFAILCKVDGEPYIDLQNDHVPEDAMLKAATDFMLHSQISGDMHARSDDKEPIPDGRVVFAFPLTEEIAKSLDIETQRTGLLIAMKPSPEVLKKFKDGTYTGFSIGGSYGMTEEAEIDG